MGGFFDPIDFSGIAGYPHDISEDAIDNMPDFFDHTHAGAHIWAFTKFIEKWCDPPVAVLMHTCRRELSPAHLVCPRRHNV